MEPIETSKQPIRTRCLGHVTGYQPIRPQGPVFSDSVGSWNSQFSPGHHRYLLHPPRDSFSCDWQGLICCCTIGNISHRTSGRSGAESWCGLSAERGECPPLSTKNGIYTENKVSLTLFINNDASFRNRPKQVTNQNSLFRSRDWLSANQRQVFGRFLEFTAQSWSSSLSPAPSPWLFLMWLARADLLLAEGGAVTNECGR
eukprot:sb/3470667/